MPSSRPAAAVSAVLSLLAHLVAAWPAMVQIGMVQTAVAQTAVAQTTGPPGAQPLRPIRIVLAREDRNRPPPVSLLDNPPQDDGLAGARLAISDNNTTGRFVGHEYLLEVVKRPSPEELVAEVVGHAAAGPILVVADVGPDTLLALAAGLAASRSLLINAGAPDDRLREEDCRARVYHTAPTRSMLADGLAQFLAWKRWRRWLLVTGSGAEDMAYAAALRRAAKRFGATIVEERIFRYDPGARRSDGGHEQIQQQIPVFMQNAKEHDVVVIADERGLFGEYVPYQTWDPRPIVGTQGLVAASWHPALEQWGATQFQNRFRRLTARDMRPLDYQVWVAVRAIGEAATRLRSAAVAEIVERFRSPELEVAAFKGRRLNFRAWNGQLRQPVLIGTAKLTVSVSPQAGFLHEVTDLDTLGFDKPETKCQAFAQ